MIWSKVMRGEVYFVWASTLERGSVRELPLDVRQMIYEWTFPHIKARCHHCKDVVLVESINHAYFQTQPFTVRDDAYWCMKCKNHTPLVIASVPFWRSLRMFTPR